MSNDAGVRPARALRRFRPLVLWVVAWSLVPLLSSHRTWLFRQTVDDAIFRFLSGFPGWALFVERLIHTLDAGLAFTYGFSLFFASLLLPIGFAARLVARARVRAGHTDPLDRIRTWMSSHPVGSTLATLVLPLASQLLFLWSTWWWNGVSLWVLGLTAFAGGLVQRSLIRGGLQSLLAPTLDGDPMQPSELDPDEIRFDAVAVTREAFLPIGILIVLSVATITWVASVDVAALFRDPRILQIMAAYVALAASAAYVFRKASRIAVGLDGVHVGGTSRARFYAFANVDELRERGGDLELVRRDRVLLRLQFHGEDAARRHVIGARIREGIARAVENRSIAAANFVTSTRSEAVARSADGGADYRTPSVSRDALWMLVEGLGVQPEARSAAARVLVTRGDPTERGRLRVVAEQCADPKMRVALEELSDPQSEEWVLTAGGRRQDRPT
jgi:hypothetical protein